MAVFLLDWFKEPTGWDMPPMLATFYLFVLCVGVQVLTSLIWAHRHTPESERLVWDHPLECLRTPGWSGIGNYKFLSVVLFVTMVVLYAIFA